MKKWDDFVKDESENEINNNEVLPLFFGKERNIELYKIFYFIIDTISYEYSHILKDMKIIVSCVLYFLIGVKLSIFNLTDIENISANEKIIEKYYNYNMFFNSFVVKTLKLEFSQFVGYFSYISLFFNKTLFEIEDDFLNNDLNVQDYSRVKKVVADEIEKKLNLFEY